MFVPGSLDYLGYLSRGPFFRGSIVCSSGCGLGSVGDFVGFCSAVLGFVALLLCCVLTCIIASRRIRYGTMMVEMTP